MLCPSVPPELINDLLQQYTETLCTAQQKTTFTNNLLQDIIIFTGTDTSQLEDWLTGIESAADLTHESHTKLAQANSKGLTCTLISEATVSLLRYSTYKSIEDCYETLIQPMTANLNTADSSLMSALGITTLHLCIMEFKFTHNFLICDQLPDTELLFGIDIQKTFSISYAWDHEKIVTCKKMENS